MIRYIYIDEDGDMGLGTRPPTGQDLDNIDNGILQVIAITTEDDGNILVKDIGPDLNPTDLLPVVLANDECGQYHWIPAS